MEVINLVIVDDKPLILSSLVEKIERNNNIKLMFTAYNGEDFLEKMKHTEELPDVVFMDIDMPIMNGIEAIQKASKIYPNIKFLILTVFDDDDKIFEAIRAGAVGYLLKDESVLRLVDAINEVMEYGGSPMSPIIARKSLRLLSQSQVNTKEKEECPLSEREMEILQHLVEGKDCKKIADEIFISPHTVRTHITNIYKKLHVNNRVQAVNLSNQNGWFEDK